MYVVPVVVGAAAATKIGTPRVVKRVAAPPDHAYLAGS